MREILFRGKRIDNGEWIEGLLGFDGVNEAYYIFGCEVDPATVDQYTGLTDKNGKRIFEGDKLLPFDGDIDKMVVGFNLGQFLLCIYGDRGYRSESGDWEYDGSNYGVIECEPLSSYGDDIMVIGNIHDNPELLKEEPT